MLTSHAEFGAGAAVPGLGAALDGDRGEARGESDREGKREPRPRMPADEERRGPVTRSLDDDGGDAYPLNSGIEAEGRDCELALGLEGGVPFLRGHGNMLTAAIHMLIGMTTLARRCPG